MGRKIISGDNVKAYRVEVPKHDATFYWGGYTASQVRYAVIRQAWDAWLGMKFGDIRVIREPVLDTLALKACQGVTHVVLGQRDGKGNRIHLYKPARIWDAEEALSERKMAQD